MTVTVNEKKEFLKHFLGKYTMKKRESVWILNFILSHDRYLERVHFVRQLNTTMIKGYAIVMSTHCIDGISIKGWVDGLETSDAEKIFHSIRLNSDEDWYIQLNFSNSNTDKNFLFVVEEIEDESELNKYTSEAEKFLNHCLSSFSKKKLLSLIDKALEQNNREEFIKLSDEYRRILCR